MEWGRRGHGGDRLYKAVNPEMGQQGEEDQDFEVAWATLQDHDWGGGGGHWSRAMLSNCQGLGHRRSHTALEQRKQRAIY